MDYYQVLGVSKDSSQEEIKKAFRKLAHQFHPDKGGDEEKFKQINEAYQILGNKEKRAQYDQFGSNFQGFQGQGGFQGTQGFDFGNIDLEDLVGDFFSFGRKKRKDVNKGQDIEVAIEIELKDTLKGVLRTIDIEKKLVCQRCDGSGAEAGSKVKECFSCRGTGEVQQMKRTLLGNITRYIICPECNGQGKIPEKPCNVCKGEGRIKDKEKIDIHVPAGVDTGQTIKITSKGEAGKRGAEPGDLYIKLFVKPHPLFIRKGDDIITEKEITFSQASLGDDIEIPTLEGKDMILKVPSGTESGKVFRMSKKGIPHFTGWGTGDLYIKLIVKTPKKLSRKQKELLEKLREQGI